MEKLSTENQKTSDLSSELEPSKFKAPTFKTLSIPQKAKGEGEIYSGVSRTGERYSIEIQKLENKGTNKATFSIPGIEISFKMESRSPRDVMSKVEAFGYSFANFTNP
jgi:hypothetical protein